MRGLFGVKDLFRVRDFLRYAYSVNVLFAYIAICTMHPTLSFSDSSENSFLNSNIKKTV